MEMVHYSTNSFQSFIISLEKAIERIVNLNPNKYDAQVNYFYSIYLSLSSYCLAF